MNILYIKLDGFMQGDDHKNIGYREAYNIAELLRKDGNTVVCPTKENYKEINPNSFDYVICSHCDDFNFFGGKVLPRMTYAYEILAKCEKQIYYLCVDMNMPLKQIWSKLKKYETNLKEEDVTITSDVIIISQGYDKDRVREIHKDDIKIKDVVYFPLNEWVYHSSDIVKSKKNVDLIAGIMYTDAFRKNKYKDYIIDRKKISSEIYGKLTEESFSLKKNNLFSSNCNTVFTPQLKSSADVILKNSTGFSTIVVGSKKWNNNMPTLRIGEDLLADCITFIDNDFDINHKIFDGLDGYLYVSCGDELEEKILRLKKDKIFLNSVLTYQHKFVKLKKDFKYAKTLLEVIQNYG